MVRNRGRCLRKLNLARAGFSAFVLSLLCANTATAQTPATWTFDGNGLWSDSAKWSIGAAPGSNHDVTIDDGDSIVTVTVEDSRTVNTLTLGSSDTLDIHAGESFVLFTSANSFTNSGNLVLTNTETSNATTRLTVATGTLTNAPSGLLRFGIGNGARLFDANLINNGTVQINKDTTFEKTAGLYANHASLSVTGGATLNIGGTGTLNNNTGGTLDLDGTLNVLNSTYNQNAGTLDFGTNAIIQNGNFNYLGGTVVGTLKLKATTFTLGAGTNPVQILMNDHNTLASDVNASQTVNVEGNESFVVLTSANSFANSGNLLLTNFDVSNATTRLTVTTGTLTNAPSGLLRFGVGNGARLFDANLLNNGTVQINKDTNFDKTAGTYANHASLSVTGGATLNIGGSKNDK